MLLPCVTVVTCLRLQNTRIYLSHPTRFGTDTAFLFIRFMNIENIINRHSGRWIINNSYLNSLKHNQ